MKKLALAIFVFAAVATAGTSFNTTVLGTDAFLGPTITVGPTSLLDVISITARGEVFLQNGNTYGTNAAGVVTTAGSMGVGGFSMCPCGATYGSLLIGNSTYGFHQIFPTDASSGAGSATPPSVLSTSETLAALGFASPLLAGTVLEFRIADTNIADNSGQLTVFGDITGGTATPEPATVALVGAAIAASVLLRRRAA